MVVLQIAPRSLSGPQRGAVATRGGYPENHQERAEKGQGSGLRSIGWGWRVLEFERAIRRLELHVEQFRTPGDIRPEIDAGCTRGQPGQSQRESVAIGGDPGTERACSTAATASASRTGRRADIHLHEARESALQDRRGVDSGSRRDRGCIRQCIEPDGRQPSALPIRGAQRALRCGVLDRHVHRERRPPIGEGEVPEGAQGTQHRGREVYRGLVAPTATATGPIHVECGITSLDHHGRCGTADSQTSHQR
jgi:hypothetical protein